MKEDIYIFLIKLIWLGIVLKEMGVAVGIFKNKKNPSAQLWE